MSRSRLFGIALLLVLTAYGCGDDSGDGRIDAGADAGKQPPPEKHDGGMNDAALPDSALELDTGTLPGACDSCGAEALACAQHEGCRKINACAVKTGCQGTACYFSEPECMAVIDEYGATSASATYADQLQRCAQRAGLTSLDLDACELDDAGVEDAGR